MNQICDELATQVPATLVGTTYPVEMGDALGSILEDQKGMQHACEAETSMMMACEPDLVDTSDLGSIGTPPDNMQGFLGAGRSSYRWRSFTHKTPDGRGRVAGKGQR